MSPMKLTGLPALPSAGSGADRQPVDQGVPAREMPVVPVRSRLTARVSIKIMGIERTRAPPGRHQWA
jgi:hypothetical protein